MARGFAFVLALGISAAAFSPRPHTPTSFTPDVPRAWDDAAIADVAKVTWYVVGYRAELLPELAAARREVLGDHAPASTLVGVQSLAMPDYLVEVEATAVIG